MDIKNNWLRFSCCVWTLSVFANTEIKEPWSQGPIEQEFLYTENEPLKRVEFGPRRSVIIPYVEIFCVVPDIGLMYQSQKNILVFK